MNRSAISLTANHHLIMPQSKDHRVEEGLEDDLLYLYQSLTNIRNIPLNIRLDHIVFLIQIHSDIHLYGF